MKCPLLMAATLMKNSMVEDVIVECLKEECAWWDLEGNQCILLTAGIALINLDQRMKQRDSPP